MMTKYDLINLDCVNCAAKFEAGLKKHFAVKNVALDFATLALHIDTKEIETIRCEIKKIEPEVGIRLKSSTTCRDEKRGQANDEFNSRREIAMLSIAFALFLIQLLFEQRLHRIPWVSKRFSS